MANEITDDDLALLGQLGVETEPTQVGGRSAKEQRVIAGFEEIERFVQEHGRTPQHGENHDIFERLYAALDALGVPYEVVFVDDGSRDRSPELLRGQFTSRPQHTRAGRVDLDSAAVVFQPALEYTRLLHGGNLMHC